MTTWLNDQYEGETKEGWYHGYGKLKMDNGIVYEGQFVKGQFHGDGKLIYPNVHLTPSREASTKHNGKKEKWSTDSTSSTTTSSTKKITGNIASMTIEGFINSTCMASNPQEPPNKPEKTSPTTYPQEPTTLETVTTNQSRASSTPTTHKF